MASFAIPLAMAGLSALGGLFGKNKQTSDTTSSSTTTPNYDPASQGLKDLLINRYNESIGTIPQWNDAYVTSGLRNLLTSSEQAQQAAGDVLSSRGINRTTAGANAVQDVNLQRGRSVSSFLNNVPIVTDQHAQSTLGGAGSFLASLPVGTTTSGSSHTVGTGGPSSPIAGFLGGGAQGLAGVLGQISANNSLKDILKSLNLNSNGTGGGGTWSPDE